MIWAELIVLLIAIAFLALYFSKQEADSDKVALKNRLAFLSKAQEPKQDRDNPFSTKIPGELKKKEDSRRFLVHLTGEAMLMRLEKQLAQADIPIRASEFILMRVVLAGVGGALGLSMSNQWMVAGGAGVLMFFIHIPYIAFMKAMRINKFTNQLADFLSLICNSLRAGQTFLQGVDMACRESPAPISTEFRQLMRETNLGLPIEESFQNMYVRVPGEDLKIVLSAFSIQRQVGGNLAEILDQVSKTIRERIKIQGQIRVLSTQGKMSGAVVGLMPIALVVIISVVSPGYMDPLLTGYGKILVGATLFWQGLGCFAIYKICDIEV